VTDTARRLIAVLKRIGFVEHHQKGSHLFLIRGHVLVCVPVHPGDLAPGTFHRILKTAGLSPDEYRKLR